MTASLHDDPHPAGSCRACRAPLAHDQRYCVECGERRSPLPAAIAELIGARAPAPTLEQPAATGSWLDGLGAPAPSVAAAAVMGLLAFGVLLGSAVSPAEPTGAAAPIVVAVSGAPSSSPAPTTTPAAPPPSSTPAAAPASTPAPTPTTMTATTPATTPTTPTAPPKSALPAVKHVFLIVLSDHGFNAAFGSGSQSPYLARTLAAQGELINNYYAVAHGELANGIGLISGQGPTPQTAANCQLFSDITPGTAGTGGQIAGSGCLYPKAAQTLGDQLTAQSLPWKAYLEDIGNGGPGQPTSCRHPALGSADADQAPRPGDAYLTWRNPFVYFHSLIDGSACSTGDVGLDQLAPDLKVARTAPAFSYIVPNRCHDGSDQPCAPGQPAGMAVADTFLKAIVPEIEASAAYKDGGLIAITFDQAPQTGPEADSTACCNNPQYPNLPAPPPAGPTSATTPTTTTATPLLTNGATAATGGGGRVGLLLISKFVKPGSVDLTDAYNHFSLLRSVEDLFGLQHLGYATDPALPAFDKTIYNATISS